MPPLAAACLCLLTLAHSRSSGHATAAAAETSDDSTPAIGGAEHGERAAASLSCSSDRRFVPDVGDACGSVGQPFASQQLPRRRLLARLWDFATGQHLGRSGPWYTSKGVLLRVAAAANVTAQQVSVASPSFALLGHQWLCWLTPDSIHICSLPLTSPHVHAQVVTERSLAKRVLELLCCVAASCCMVYSEVLELLRTVCWVAPLVALTRPARLRPLAWSILTDAVRLALVPFGVALHVGMVLSFPVLIRILYLRDGNIDVLDRELDLIKARRPDLKSETESPSDSAAASDSGYPPWPLLLLGASGAIPAAAFWLRFVVAWSLVAAALCLYQLIRDACVLTCQCAAAACQLCG